MLSRKSLTDSTCLHRHIVDADLDALIADLRSAGLQISVSGLEDAPPLDPEVELAGYRVVQESLTNALKHSVRRDVSVKVSIGSKVTVQISSRGAALDQPATGVCSGVGLRGLRERVEGVGGRFTVDAAVDRFTVRADLPDATHARRNRPVTVPIRVLVADDEAIVCSGMAMLLAAEPDIDVVGQANSGAAALRAVEELRPDVLVLDVRMPDLDGAETTALLTARNADRERGSPKVLIVTTLAGYDADGLPRPAGRRARVRAQILCARPIWPPRSAGSPPTRPGSTPPWGGP